MLPEGDYEVHQAVIGRMLMPYDVSISFCSTEFGSHHLNRENLTFTFYNLLKDSILANLHSLSFGIKQCTLLLG